MGASRAIAVVAGLAVLAVAACDDGPASNQTYVHPAGSWSFMVAATRDGPLLVEIHGVAVDGDGPAQVEAVLELMGDAIHRRGGLQFTADRAAAANPAYRVAWTFNAAAGLGSRQHCNGEGQGQPPQAEGRVEILATFCDEDRVLANVRGWVEDVQGLEDKRFQRLVKQVTRELFVKPVDR